MSPLFLLLSLVVFCSAASVLDSSESDLPNDVNEMLERTFDMKESEWNRRHHHRHHFPPPPFLRKVSRRARREFYRIIYNRDVTRTEKLKQLDEWAKKQGHDILKDLHDYEKKVKKYVDELHKNTTDTIGQLADSYKKVHEILSNPNLTPREAWKQLKDLCLPTAVVRSLRAISFIVAHPHLRSMEENMPTFGFAEILGGFGFEEDFYGKSEGRQKKEKEFFRWKGRSKR